MAFELAGSVIIDDNRNVVAGAAATFTYLEAGTAQFTGSYINVDGNLDVASDIRHLGDSDTKIVFTDNQIDLQTGGYSRLYASNYGVYVRSGFGLSFLASSGASPAIKSGGTNNQDLLLTTGTDNPTRLHIKSDGKVGIGTDAPDTLLHAEGSGSTGITFEGSSSNTNHISGDAGTYLILKNKSATDNNFSNILGVDAGGQATSQISFISESQSNNAGVLAFATRVASGSMAERLRITSAGHLEPYANTTYTCGTSSKRWSVVNTNVLSASSYASVGSIVAADPGSDYYAWNNRIGSGLAVAGTTYLNGSVGIGTVTPTRELTIYSPDSGSTYINLTNATTGTTTSDGFGIGLGGDEDAKLWNYENTHMMFGTNNTERLRISSAGYVGIGTQLPDKTGIQNGVKVLELSGGDGGELIVGNNASHNVSAAMHVGAVAFKNIDSSTGSVPHYAGIRCKTTDTSGNMDLRFYTGINKFETDRPQVLIDNVGKVGIGTDNPLSGLHISDGTAYGTPQNASKKATLIISAGSEGSSDIQLLSANYNHIFFGDSADANTGTIWYEHTGGGTDSMHFSTAGTERLRIDSTGDVRFAGTNLTDDTNKNVNLTAPSYDIDEEDVNLVQVENEAASNQISFGGGTSGLNAATTIRFLTASAVNTVTGTERLRITSGGVINFGHGTDINLHGKTTTGVNINGNGNSGQIIANADGNRALIIGRQSSYGQVIEFFQGTNTNEAAITIPAADAFGIETAGTERLRITSVGDVGIGTVTPASKLHLYDAISDGLTVQSPLGSHYIWAIQANDNLSNGSLAGELGIRAQSGLSISANGGSATQFRIDSSGRLIVGGGTDTSQTTITAKGNSSSATSFSVIDLRRGEAADAVNDVLGYIRFSDTNIDSGNQNYAHIHAAVDAASTNSSDNPGRLVFSTTADGDPGPTERVRIDSSGNVGIGYTRASNFLAGANNLVVGSGSGDEGITIYSGSSASNYGSIYFADGTSGAALNRGMIRYEQNNEVMSFHTNNNERLTIDLNGNVGIGSEDPDEKLVVAGILKVYGSDGQAYGPRINPNSTGGTYEALIGSSNGDLRLQAGSGGYQANRANILLKNSNNDVIINAGTTSGGNVGIRTSTTSAVLDVGNTGIATATTMINADAWDGQVFNVDGNITSDSIFAVNDISGLPVIDFNATHGLLSLAPFGGNVSIGYTNSGTKLGLKGSTSEKVYIVADELSDQTLDTINIDNGNVQYFTTAENGGTLTPDITSNAGLNTDLAIGDSTTVVVIIKPDSTDDKITNITIDSSAATEEWLGGSAPTGGANGSYDVYTFFILKTADATFLPLCNKVNFA